jgi:PhnB protein
MAEQERQTQVTSGVIPHLTIGGGKAKDAVDFYTKAFGAEETMRMPAEDGKRLLHSHLKLNGGSLMVADDFPEYSGRPAMTQPAGSTFHIEVPDADAAWERALAAGASVAMPIGDQFWGARYGQVTDPFGHRWSIGGPLKKAG